jgi:hypothetical protein
MMHLKEGGETDEKCREKTGDIQLGRFHLTQPGSTTVNNQIKNPKNLEN